MEKRTFNVSGMKCPHCKANVENALKALNGVQDAVADLENKNVTVEYDSNLVDERQLKDAVDESGRYELSL